MDARRADVGGAAQYEKLTKSRQIVDGKLQRCRVTELRKFFGLSADSATFFIMFLL
jgi:hypothetical protein